jgi:Na+/melibiose symporter-like transporter
MTVAELISALQMAVGPAVLISGVGLLILSLTNRLGRIVDRGRSLVREDPESKRPSTAKQLVILVRRAQLLRNAIVYSVLSVLFSSVLIIVLFFTASLQIETTWIVGALFVGALGTMVLSLIYFLRELNQSLIAFRMDIGK